MDKQLLQKLYTLRNLKADQSFKENTKRNILEGGKVTGEKTLWDLFKDPVPVNGLAMAAVFAFFVMFVSLAFPFTPLQQEDHEMVVVDFPQVEEREEELREVAESEERENQSKEEDSRSVEREFAEVEENYRSIQREVLGMMIKDEKSNIEGELTDEEIAEYLLDDMEKADKEEKGEEMISIMSQEKEEDDKEEKEDLQRAREAMKEEDYETVFDIYITNEYN